MFSTLLGIYSHTLVLTGFKPGTRQTLYLSHFNEKKSVSALNTCSGHVALARIFMSHNAAPQKKMVHHLVPVGLGTSHSFWSKLMMSTEVPLYLGVGWHVW